MLYIRVILLLLFSISFSYAENLISLENFSRPINEFYTILIQKELRNDNCESILQNANQNIFSDKIVSKLERNGKKDSVLDLIQSLFLIRIELRHVFGDISKNIVNEACVIEVRNALRNIRVLEEYLAEWQSIFYPAPVALEGDFPHFLLNPAHSELKLKAGDLILSRGNVLASAMIARFGNVDGLFSHLSIVHIDEKTKEVFIVQSEAEGVIITPLHEYARDGKLRAVVFRQKDEILAKRASNYIYTRAKAAKDAGANIPYDFTMRVDDDSQMFCAEVTYVAYKESSDGEFIIAPFRSKFIKQSDRFLDDLGVLTRETLTPMDIELDSRFELVAEWRNLAVTSDARMKDAIFTKIFEWMSKDRFEFTPSSENYILQNIGWFIRRWPVLGRIFEDRFPEHMKASVIGLYFTMEEMGEPLVNILNGMNLRSIMTTGYPMIYTEVLAALDSLLARDKVLLEKWNDWKFWYDLSPEAAGAEPDRPIILEKFHP